MTGLAGSKVTQQVSFFRFEFLSGDEGNRKENRSRVRAGALASTARTPVAEGNQGTVLRARVPFKELQVLRRRPQLLEAGRCPHAGMVVY